MMSEHKDGEQEFKYRGESMTRIETFVAAAFAFAVTMLIIGSGDMPKDMAEFMTAVRNVPGFIASCALIIWIWFSHADWSRRYGLEDGKTIVLSGTMICIVLVYIYPLRLMMQGLFFMVSGGYFPFELVVTSYDELRFLFLFYAAGFMALSLNFMALYRHSLNRAEDLSLSELEIYQTKSAIEHWFTTAGVCIVTIVVTFLVPNNYITYSPFLYCLLWPVNHWIQIKRSKQWELINSK